MFRDVCQLEYRVRAPVFYGELREHMGDRGFPRIPTGIVLYYYMKPPGVSGIM